MRSRMIHAGRVGLVLFASLASTSGVHASATSQSATSQEVAVYLPVASESAAFLSDPALGLADPADDQSELCRTRELLEEWLHRQREPLDEAEAHLALANWLLATSPGRATTRWLMGLHVGADLEVIAVSAHKARMHLDQARVVLQSEAVKKLKGEDKRCRRELKRVEGLLRPFADFFAAVETPTDSETGRSGWAEAALRLSVSRETEDAEMAACALLWQSFAWELAGRRDRALASLPDVLQVPKQLPYDFFCRLLRCRILADAGQHTAALVLMTKMVDVARHWFRHASPESLNAYVRLVAVVQYQIGQAWIERFDTPGQITHLEAIRAMLNRVKAELLGEGDEEPVEVYFLERAIPLLVEAHAIEEAVSATTTSSAPVSMPSSVPAEADDEFVPASQEAPDRP